MVYSECSVFYVGRICDPVPVTAAMEISLLKELLNNITLSFHLSSCDKTDYIPVQKFFQRIEDMLKLLKPVLEAIVDSEVTSNELFIKAFEELGRSVDDLRELFENMHPLKSKVYFVCLFRTYICCDIFISYFITISAKKSYFQITRKITSANLSVWGSSIFLCLVNCYDPLC